MNDEIEAKGVTAFFKKNQASIKIGGLAIIAVVATMVVYSAGMKNGIRAGSAGTTSRVNDCLKRGVLVWGDGMAVTGASKAAVLAAEAVKAVAEANKEVWSETFPTTCRKTIG